MKKILVAAVVMVMFAAPAFAAIATTAHDLSTGGAQGAATGTDEVCVFCHTPHGGVADFPLWNRTNVTASGAYSSTTLNATVGGVPGEAGACLSCHDGASLVAAGTIVNAPNNATAFDVSALTMSDDANIGTDMSNDHPVGFTYDAALVTADGGTGLVVPAGGTVGTAALPLFGGEMWCSTCHDVHDDTNGQFLQATNAGSALCTNCHNK